MPSGTSAGYCNSGYACGYQDNLDDDQRYSIYQYDADLKNNTFANSSTVVHDNISAARNNSKGGNQVVYYYNENYNLAVFCVNPGSAASFLPSEGVAGDGRGKNDEASSVRFVPGTNIPGCY